MSEKKCFVLLPDGVGLRNFAYSSFSDLAAKNNTELVFWNSTPFDLDKMGYNEQKAPQAKLHKFTDIYKVVRKNIELNLYKKKTNDAVYDSYSFPRRSNTISAFVKNVFISWFTKTNNSDSGLNRVRKKIIELEKQRRV